MAGSWDRSSRFTGRRKQDSNTFPQGRGLMPRPCARGWKEAPLDWVFQANPSLYDVLEAIKQSRNDSNWAMNQHRHLVHPGDRVFFWRSGSNAAIVAIGRIVSTVRDRGIGSKFGRFAVDVEYDYRVEPPLLRVEIKSAHPLDGVRVFMGVQGTNFRLNAEEAHALEALLQKRLVKVGDASA
jgi:hypothetical protein